MSKPHRVNVSVSAETLTLLQHFAAAHGISVSAAANIMIVTALDNLPFPSEDRPPYAGNPSYRRPVTTPGGKILPG